MEWLQEILKKAGVEKVEEIEKAIQKELPKYFKPADVFNETNEKLKTTEGELNTLKATRIKEQEEYENYKKGSISQEDYEAKKKELEDNLSAELEAVKKDSKIEVALIKAGARNTKSVKANLDLSKVTVDGEKLIGFDEQVNVLKTSDAYLFTDTNFVNKGVAENEKQRKNEDGQITDSELDAMSDEEYFAYVNKI